MKYADLIQFEPVESVVQLREADAEGEALRLVDTFVISDRVKGILKDTVFPHLQFDHDADNKGLLVVGNYGTGKSHLMAVISAIAEREELAARLTDASLAGPAASIAGRFKVIRAEIGSTTMSLRDIVCGILESGLATIGVTFRFPSANERHENKSALIEMMAAFEQSFPDKGLVLVLDELLDYLRSRRDQEAVLDLSFLREVGEISSGTRFRFIAGVQESLFDNPRFQFIADPLRRVKDRFEQVRIARDDVAFVVAHRILKKTAQQEADIRAHLSKFGPLYGSLTERMDEFVRLFPVHPAYLDVFERVSVAEKREVLKTLSLAIGRIINDEVPTDEPGLIAYDSYWRNLKDNPSFRADPDIKEVIDRSTVLEDRIKLAFTKPAYRPVALRIVHALSVHRLTTADIYAPLGPTAEELRDDLCLILPTPQKEAEFLKSLVETVMNEIVKTVSGQFISHNRDNGQFYLDLKKDVDFDALIERRGESLESSKLDEYYFDALRRVILEDPDAAQYVPGYRIWEHELEWTERKAGRSGYLFFGAPNQRSTAQPPRDFYLYFLQVYDVPVFKDTKGADEVFFRLTKRDAVFEQALKMFAGAKELWTEASSGNKPVYDKKAGDQLKILTAWLREHMSTALEVTYQGRAKTMQATVQGRLPSTPTVRDYVNTAGSVLLATHFADLAPKYPIFQIQVTAQNREQAAQDALRWISGTLKSKQGTAVLDALGLLDGDAMRPQESEYAKQVLALLMAKGQGQVLNRSELVSSPFVGIEVWTEFAMEPEFLAVVLAALTHNGDIVINIPGKKLDASSVDQFAKIPVAELANFKHLERPKDIPIGALRDLCELLGVPPGLIVDPANRDAAVAQIQVKASETINRLMVAASKSDNLQFMGHQIVSVHEAEDWRTRLNGAKAFLEGIQAFNTAGKLKNFPHDSVVVTGQKKALDLCKEVESLGALIDQLGHLTNYLEKAEILLDKEHPWQSTLRTARAELLVGLADPQKRASPNFRHMASERLATVKADYQQSYLSLHKAARLGAAEDKRKDKLVKDTRLSNLRSLAGIEVMPSVELRNTENELIGIRSCFAVTAGELDKEPLCPHCQFRPSDEPQHGKAADRRLLDVDEKLDAMTSSWTRTLLENLEDPSVVANVTLVSDPTGKAEIEAFMAAKAMPDVVAKSFVKGLQEVFGGLQRVGVERKTLHAALHEGGMPCTVATLKERFDVFVKTITHGKDPSKVRIVIE